MLPVSNRPGCKIVITRQMQKFVCGLYLVFPHTNMLTLISIAATRLSVYRETPWCEIWTGKTKRIFCKEYPIKEMTQSLQIHIYSCCKKNRCSLTFGGKKAKSTNRLCDQANAQQYKDYQNIISCGTSCLDLWHNLTTSDREQSVLHQLFHVAFPFSQQIYQLHRCQDSGKDLEKITVIICDLKVIT